ncbi:MAG: hypothetical protein LUH14_13110 [Clostridiaceae bacterium]|nr:hypothetical protein [Clostridiaceae bacterium]
MEAWVKIVFVLIVLIILFAIQSVFDRKYDHKQKSRLMEQEWGCCTRDEYSDRIMKNIRYFHEHSPGKAQIDSITWNDLDMDTIFSRLNHTRTSAGEEYFYHLLRSPVFDAKVLEEREKVIQSFQENAGQRMEFEILLSGIGKTDRISVYEFLNETKNLKNIRRFPHVLAALVLAGAAVSLIAAPAVMLILLFSVMGINIYFYYKEKAAIVENLALFQFILGIIRQSEKLGDLDLPGCESYFAQLRELSGKFHKFSRFHFLISGGNSASSVLFNAVFDYVRIFFHVDLIKIGTMIREVQKYQTDLLAIYRLTGWLESMLAVASYRTMLEEYCVPQLGQAALEGNRLAAEGLYHPLLQKPVKNDIHMDKSVLITGSNASGKSTFIKALAVNAIFAQTIHTVLAKKYQGSFFRVYSSMALRDNILSQESYFIVEIKSLQRIFRGVEESDIPVLCFIDEILRGTNTVERVAASSQLLQELAGKNAICFAATHDIELTYLLEGWFDNYHFEEILEDGDISFDYKLRKGRAASRNAIRLLELIGFDESVVKKARERVDRFLEQGVWQ